MAARTQQARTEPKTPRRGKALGYVLWLVQALLALVFLFTGGTKLLLPGETLVAQMPVALPVLFVRFIAVMELLGSLGLILPGVLRVREELTPLAAAGLVVIMAGATVLTLLGGGGALALIPFVLGLFAAFVAYGRWRLRPLGE